MNPIKKKRWFLLRGLARETGHWASFVSDLKAATFSSDVHGIDLPGCGVFHKMKSPWSVEPIRDHVRAEFQTILHRAPLRSAEEEPWVLAISFGGMVALDWLSCFPSELAGGVIINTSLKRYNRMLDRISLSAFLTLLKAASAKTIEEREHHVIGLVCNRDDAEQRLLGEWVEVYHKHPVKTKTAVAQIVAAARYSGPVQIPKQKLLFISSRADRLASYRCTEAIASALGAPAVFHDSAGHDLPSEDSHFIVSTIASLFSS